MTRAVLFGRAPSPTPEDACAETAPACVSRRELLFGLGATVVALGALSLPKIAVAAETQVRVAQHPRRRLARLSQLVEGRPVEVRYPFEHPHCTSFLVKLGTRAGAGVGPEADVVGFNALCTHMGALLAGTYDHRYRVAGPCPLHLTTFDLTRHGIVVAGQATESLPQLQLALEGDDIVATGVMGLIYGFATNDPPRGSAPEGAR